MTLTALRTHDEDLRRRLAAVREALTTAVMKVEIGERAESELAAARERSGAQGAYRDVAAERAQQWTSEVEEGKQVAEKRERLRREEASLLEELETARLEIERAGVKQHVLPVLASVPAASACATRWHEMTGDGDARVCPRCAARVMSLVMLDAEGAQALVRSAGGAGALRRRADGTFVVGDCSVGAATAQKWRAAPLAIAAGFLVGGVAAIVAVVVVGAKKVSAVDPMPPPIPTPSATATASSPRLRVRDATAIVVDDTLVGLGASRSIRAKLERGGDHFTYTSACNGGADGGVNVGTVPTPVVEAFLSAVEADPPTDGPPARCTHTDDFPQLSVVVTTPSTTVELRVRNCSRQWYAGPRPLAADTGGARSEPHPEINAAYEKLLARVGVNACPFAPFERSTRPPPRYTQTPRCNPPYTVDANGVRRFKRECLR